MARSGDEKTAGAPQEWKQLVSGGGLFAAVLAILVFGALRETPEAPSAPPLPRASVAPVAPPPPLETPAPEPEGAGEDALLARSVEDPARILRGSGEWTLQLVVACERATAQRVVERSGDSGRLYVLPVTLQGRECYRLCWGSYGSREDAARAEDLPSAVRAALDRPEARKIREMAQ